MVAENCQTAVVQLRHGGHRRGSWRQVVETEIRMEESLGALLSRVRLDRGRSQLRVAELLCAASGVPTVSRHEISRWEREIRIPSPFWLRWLAFVLDIDLDELERAATYTRRVRPTVSIDRETREI